MEDDLPYTAEYAKSGRASCKGCKTPIAQATLRIAVMVQSHHHDGKQPNWFHKTCFFKKQRPKSEGDIGNFQNIRYEDQQELKKIISETADIILPTKGKGKKRSKAETMALKDFGIEYAKSSRATCCGCHLKIQNKETRIKKVVFDTEVGIKFGGQPLWHHVDCFAQVRNDLGWFESGTKLPGFSTLNKEDQEKVKQAIPAANVDDVPDPKKLKIEPKSEKETEEEIKLEDSIKKQTEIFFNLRDNIQMHMTRNDMLAILHANGQKAIEDDREKFRDQVADILTFGALAPCKNCNGGQFVFSTSGYLCTGDLTEWTKCAQLEKEPKRVSCKVPKKIKDKYPFLNKYKCVVQNRIIRQVVPSTQALQIVGKIKKNDELDGPKVKRDKPPLYEFLFSIIGLLKFRDSIKERILKLGGKVVPTISEKIIAVISTPEEVEKLTGRMQQAKELGIHVVPVEYLDAVESDPSGAVTFISSKSICDWGTDPNARLPVEVNKSGKSKSIYTKSAPSSMTLKLKDGLAVDPDSGLADVGHVYVTGKKKYSTVLGLTDIQRNKNKYYKMQIIESDGKNRYWLFRSWGRIGTTIGSNKLVSCDTVHSAIQLFEEYYMEKSGNMFGTKDFIKRPELMYPIDIDYGDEKKVDLNVKHSVKSKLPQPVQELVKLIFDVDAMKKVMMEFHLDMEKMPLGKLSKKQIQSAYKVLTEISELIQNGGNSARFIDATNRFYTLIPQNFGVGKPPILDSTEEIKNLSEMLDSLMEIECAYSMISNEDSEAVDGNPIDLHYEQLKTKLLPIDKGTDEFKLLEKYVQNTHAETHRMYDLEVMDIFKVERSGEARRYKPFKKLHNRKLLWHGSRLTNYAGILSHGLKIAPPEAPSTGYMFGKGIYFADMVSKSANYCFTSSYNSTGLLLLSEVALGNMYERLGSDFITKLPNDKHSTKGVGQTQPNIKESFIREDGVEIPLGRPITDNKIKSSLLYNEYIVYDASQVNIQYLLKMNFKYKY